ncbi:Bug family tripartite tricarboxylate transporter substrate binding protein [Schauerella aestuarii]|uniref:Bug family tripartite tricarboxylate transporter substrate binding protein n=1 Tax=Schauerella aestuarii TaxID=2511204 RepID=UPI001926727E|nr:tripartite tricarboxylate transporter substrate binding protein [Achromobacter aestuarii]
MFNARFITTLRRTLALATVTSATALAPLAAHSAESTWPDKPVTVIVPSAAGGGADVLTRIVITHLARATNQTFVIENRPGAGGAIGMTQIKRAAPDGYTLGYGNLNTLAVNPSLFNKLAYDPSKDFAFIGPMFTLPNLLVVRADAPYKSVADLVAAAKAKPGKLFWAAANLGSSGHMGGELFKRMADIDASYVPYNGDPASLTDLVGGQLDFAITNAPIAWPLVQAGKLRALAITSSTRVPLFPNIPTMDESGLKGYDNGAWGGLIFPAGTPQPIVDRASAVLEKVMNSDGVKDDLAKAFATPTPGTQPDFVRFVAAEQKKWADVIASANIEKQN